MDALNPARALGPGGPLPLGSAAGYGAPLPLDREAAARALGFAQPEHNVAAVRTEGKLRPPSSRGAESWGRIWAG
jgi:hypothetical protein